MTYRIQIDKPAMKFLQKQPQAQRERLLRAIQGLPNNGDIKPMSGHENLYRLRVGAFRVLYTIIRDLLIVRVLSIGNRGDVYK